MRLLTRFSCGPLLLLIGFTAVAGCGPSKPVAYPVTGTVTYQDQPVEGAQVMFTQTGARAAEGTTDAAGKFTLTTFASGDGALPGTHKITVVKMVSQDPSDPYSPAKNVLPARYATPTESPLEHTVTAGGANEVPLKLTDG